jgi:hypothetical protein
VARARVPAERQAAYLAELRALARAAEAGGAHVWVFRSRHDPDLFLEFREGKGDPPEDGAEAAARLRALATYEPGADEAWEEVR